MAYDESLVLDMPFMNSPDAAIAGAVRDFSGYGNHGTPGNFVGDDSEFIDGHLGQSITLPGGGADKHLDCGNNNSINNVPLVTVEAVMTPNAVAAFGDIVSNFNPAGNLTYLIIEDNVGAIYFYTGGSAAANAATTPAGAITAGNVYWLVGVHDGINTSIYVNGIWIANAVTPLAPVASTTNLFIGMRSDSTTDVNAIIHRVRIWNRALGAAEIYRRFIHAKRM